MKKVGIEITCLLLILALVIPATAAKPTVYKYTEYGKVFGPWNYTDTSQGPAKYYGYSVRIKYVCTNKWTITENVTDNWVRFHYTHIGTAEIYDMVTGNLIETRKFTASQSVRDDGIDGVTRYGPTPSTTDPTLMIIYYLITNPSNVEEENYIWKIAGGVYTYHHKIKNGVVTVSIHP